MILPVTFKSLGAAITIREEDLTEGLGCWDERTGTITLRSGLDPMGKLVILVHEAMHAVESMLIQNGAIKRRVDHDFIEGAAFGLATILVYAGAVQGVGIVEWNAFVDAQKLKPKGKRRARK